MEKHEKIVDLIDDEEREKQIAPIREQLCHEFDLEHVVIVGKRKNAKSYYVTGSLMTGEDMFKCVKALHAMLLKMVDHVNKNGSQEEKN